MVQALWDQQTELAWFVGMTFKLTEAWEKVRYEAGSDFPQQLADEVREAVKKALREAVR